MNIELIGAAKELFDVAADKLDLDTDDSIKATVFKELYITM